LTTWVTVCVTGEVTFCVTDVTGLEGLDGEVGVGLLVGEGLPGLGLDGDGPDGSEVEPGLLLVGWVELVAGAPGAACVAAVLADLAAA
jgi:hypothetical protein